MEPTPAYVLNEGQQKAADGFFEFLFNDDTELIISGPGGVGKTYLMGYLIDVIMSRYNDMCKLLDVKEEYTSVIMTATTNKAAEVLGVQTNRPTQTIQSYLNLRVKDNYSTGVSTLERTAKWEIKKNTIIFVDEASMTDRQLLTHVRDTTHKCKIVYVGDHCQLAPVKETISPIYNQRLPFFELTEPMRNNGQPALMALCNQLRQTVETEVFKPIRTTPGVVDLFSDQQFEQYIIENFKDGETNQRILAYTNKRVTLYNDFIRQLREQHQPYVVGETLINNSAITMQKGILSVEEEVFIEALADENIFIPVEQDVMLEVAVATLKTPYGDRFHNMYLPVDREHYSALVKHYQRTKNWNRYYYLKNQFPDLRARDAQTVHKSQGSTYDTVLIDLHDLSTCHQPNLAARLLYVAVSRARHRVIFYGALAEKYGGVFP